MLHWTVTRENRGEDTTGLAVAVGRQVYVFTDSRGYVSVHVFNTVTLCWVKVTIITSEEVPSWHWGCTAVLIEDTVYLWGGYPCYNVLYAFDVDAHRWFKPQVSGTVLEKRWNHSACVLGKVMYIHGGNPQQIGMTNDLYKLDTTTMVWALIKTTGTPPPASYQHSATIIGTKMFVFGGWGGSVLQHHQSV